MPLPFLPPWKYSNLSSGECDGCKIRLRAALGMLFPMTLMYASSPALTSTIDPLACLSFSGSFEFRPIFIEIETSKWPKHSLLQVLSELNRSGLFYPWRQLNAQPFSHQDRKVGYLNLHPLFSRYPVHARDARGTSGDYCVGSPLSLGPPFSRSCSAEFRIAGGAYLRP